MRRDRGRRGFTLLEALVALAVVAVVAAPMLQLFVTSRATARAASRELAARLVFDRLLASVPVALGTAIAPRSGSDGGFDWTIAATPMSGPAVAARPATTDADLTTFVPYRVRITLADGPRTTALETVRLGRAPTAGATQ